MNKFRIASTFALAALLPLASATLANAQQRQQDRDRDQRDSSAQRSQASSWVRVGADFNNDGRFDTVRWMRRDVFARSSRQGSTRQQQATRSGEQERRYRPQLPREQRRPQKRLVRVRGELQQRKLVDLVGDGEKDVVIARLQTESGKQVDTYLGPNKRLEKLELTEGDQLTVEGHLSQINEQPFVVGHRVSSGEKSVTNRPPRRQTLRHYRGKIKDLRTTSFRGRDGNFLVAKLTGEEGRSAQINLGKKRNLTKLNLEEGDQISVLARTIKIGGKSALIAQLVRANDRTADVREETKQQLKRPKAPQDQ